jgi:hypothetical protein
VQAVTVTMTVSPGRPELLCRTLLPKSSLASRTASSPQGCPGPSTAPTNARTTRARSPRPATLTLSRTFVPAISAPAFPSARKHRKSERTHANARSPQPLTSSRICVPGADRGKSIRRDPPHPGAYCRLAPRPAGARDHLIRPGRHLLRDRPETASTPRSCGSSWSATSRRPARSPGLRPASPRPQDLRRRQEQGGARLGQGAGPGGQRPRPHPCPYRRQVRGGERQVAHAFHRFPARRPQQASYTSPAACRGTSQVHLRAHRQVRGLGWPSQPERVRRLRL